MKMSAEIVLAIQNAFMLMVSVKILLVVVIPPISQIHATQTIDVAMMVLLAYLSQPVSASQILLLVIVQRGNVSTIPHHV